jgi:hypothetical protein
MNKRELANSPVAQSVREKRARRIELQAGLGAGSPSVKVFDELTGVDISAVAGVLTGAASITDDVFTTPQIQPSTAWRSYRVECWFTVGSEQWIRYFRLIAEA